jgi:hypothetical protein
MSTNIHISGIREVTVVKTGVITTQNDNFEVWQTPSAITKQIMAASDKVKAYKDWILSNSVDNEEPVYAEDDIFCEKEPIGTCVYNPSKEHIEDFDLWLQMMATGGYDIEFTAW